MVRKWSPLGKPKLDRGSVFIPIYNFALCLWLGHGHRESGQSDKTNLLINYLDTQTYCVEKQSSNNKKVGLHLEIPTYKCIFFLDFHGFFVTCYIQESGINPENISGILKFRDWNFRDSGLLKLPGLEFLGFRIPELQDFAGIPVFRDPEPLQTELINKITNEQKD